MTSASLERLQRLFQKAIALDGEDREGFIAEVQNDDAEAAARLRALLSADEDGTDLGAPVAASARALADDEDPWLGRTIDA